MAAVPLHLTGASLNCATKVFTGLKSQSSTTSLFSSSTPNLTNEFHQKVNKGLQIRSRNKRAGGRVWLMPLVPPMVHYHTPGGGYEWITLWNAFYRDRVVFIGRTIDESFSNQMIGLLLYLDTMDSDEPVLLYLNSPGGDIHACLALYDTLQSLETDVGTLNLSLAGDVVGFILAAGDKGRRVSMPLAKVDIRTPMGRAFGRADDVQVEANELLRIRDYLFSQFAKHTGQPIEKVNEDLSKSKHFRVEEALAYGIIDRCVKSAKPEKDPEQKPKSRGRLRFQTV